MSKSDDKYTVVSLFSGGMGLDIGLELTGHFEVLACVEKVPAFCETIRMNRDAGRLTNPDLLVYESDIRRLDPAEVLADIGMEPGEVDVIIGGPPCQAFSTSGRRRTVQDPRGTLLWHFLRFVDVMQPKFFLMENVRGLMSAALRHRPIKDRPEKGGPPLESDEEPGSVIHRFLADLHDQYRIDCFLVNAVNYGAPQIRERAIFFGNRLNHLIEFPQPTHGEIPDAQPVLPELERNTPKPFKTLGEALDGLDETEPEIMDFSPRKKHYLSMVPPGGNWRTLPDEIAKESMGKAYFAKGGRSGWWRRLSFDLPAPTVMTAPNHAGTSLCHPTEVRALTLAECARIQEFPDDWKFSGTTAQKYRQVGNAVPVRLGRVAAEVLNEHLGRINREHPMRKLGDHPIFRTVYLRSHIRTRQWYKDGKVYLWQDGEDNDDVKYGPAKTDRKVLDTVEG